MSSKSIETPATSVNDEAAETTETTEEHVNSAIEALMQTIQEKFIPKETFWKRAAIIAGVAGATALAVGIAIGRSSSNEETDEETETIED